MALFQFHQRLPSTDKLVELWCVEYDLIKEGYVQFVKSRGIDPGQDHLQIFAGSFEFESGKTREDRTCKRR
jgi:hypothetical protein